MALRTSCIAPLSDIKLTSLQALQHSRLVKYLESSRRSEGSDQTYLAGYFSRNTIATCFADIAEQPKQAVNRCEDV